jgi:EpsI family protein
VSFDFRFALAAFLLAGSALFIQRHHRDEIISAHQPIPSMPVQLGAWSGTDEPIPAHIRQVLGDGDFLLRTYRDNSASPSPVNLFMAYFPTQRTGDTIHSPLNCLPGSGWFPLEASRIMLSVPGHRPFPVNRYYVAKGSDRALVFYWYWAHGRGVASEYWAKLYLVGDSIRLNRSDGALIRITTPVGMGETVVAAEQTLTAFGEQLVPLIDDYVPR